MKHQNPKPLSSFDKTDLNRIAGRIMEIPQELGRARGKLTALRAEKRSIERDIKKRQTIIKRELAEDAEYAALPNAAERGAFYDETCQLDPNLESLTDRLLQLQAAIDVAHSNVDTLEDERKACYGVLTAYHAAVMDELRLDEAFANAQLSGAQA